MLEKTIRKSFSLAGKGLHTGEPVKVRFKPAAAGTGVLFSKAGKKPGLASDFAASSAAAGRRSTVGSGASAVETVEHLMSALAGLGVTNLLVEIDGPEIPALDGSAFGCAHGGRLKLRRRGPWGRCRERADAAAARCGFG